MSATIKRLVRFARLRFEFGRVPKADICIIDSDSASLLRRYFPDKKVLTIEVGIARRYFFPLLACLFRGQSTIDAYIARVINRSKASLALSLQDNLVPLFKVKPRLKYARIALIQNGVRAGFNDLFSSAKVVDTKLEVDYYLSFTNAVEDQIHEFASARVETIGSFRSNVFAKAPSVRGVLSYISTYNPEVPLRTAISVDLSTPAVTYEDVLARRIEILEIVAEYMVSLGYRLGILGKQGGSNAVLEEAFYRDRLPTIHFTYQPRDNYGDNYQRVDESWISVSTSSTLGYESLGRGNRTGIFQGDSILLGDSSLRFGWPAQLPPEGPFWSTTCTKERIVEVLELLHHSDDSEWSTVREEFAHLIPNLDSGNSRFVNLFKEFGATGA